MSFYFKSAYKYQSSRSAGGREDKKVEEYSNLSDNHLFVDVGVETYGAYCP